MAEALEEDGAHVVLSDIDRLAAEVSAGDLAQRDASAESLPLDVSDPSSIASGMAAIEARYGRLNILVNNAGISL